MPDDQCPFCSSTIRFSSRGEKRWMINQTNTAGEREEVLVATDLRWHCERCGKLFTERVATRAGHSVETRTIQADFAPPPECGNGAPHSTDSVRQTPTPRGVTPITRPNRNSPAAPTAPPGQSVCG